MLMMIVGEINIYQNRNLEIPYSYKNTYKMFGIFLKENVQV